MKIWKLIFIAILIVSNSAHAEDLSAARDNFIKGNEAYKSGEYQKALDYYLAAAEESEGFPVYFNTGNAYFKLGEIPESILFYERALKFDPDNEDVRYNLSLANDLIADKIETLPKSKLSIWWETFRYRIGPDGWALICLALSVISVLLFLLYLFGRGKGARRLGFFGGILGVVFVILSYTLAASAEEYRYSEKAAIVFADKIDVKSEPREESTEVFVLHAGSKVELISSEDDWYEIKIANGSQGWIPKEKVEVI